MKNLVMGNDYIETYDDVFSKSTCSELIKLVEEKNERVENEHKPNFYQRNIGNMPEYSGMYKKFSELGMDYLKELGYSDDYCLVNMDLKNFVLKNMRLEIHLINMLMFQITNLHEDGLPFWYI